MGFIGRFGKFSSSAGTFGISGIVVDGSAAPLTGVVVNAGSIGSVTTGSDGTWSFSNIAAGTSYSITATLSGYTFNGPITGILNNSVTGQTFTGVVPYSPFNFYTAPTDKYWFNYTDSAKVLATGGSPAGDTIGIATVNPEAGGVATLTGTQSTAGNQPVVAANALGSLQAMSIASGKKLVLSGSGNTSAPRNTGKVSAGAILKPLSTGGNNFLQFCYEATFSNHRWAAYTFGTAVAIDVTPLTAAHSTLFTGNGMVSTSAWVSLLWEWDAVNGAGKIYVNGVSQSLTGSWPAAGNIANTAIANNPPDLVSGNLLMIEQFMVQDALMGDTNALAWHNAAKAHYGF